MKTKYLFIGILLIVVAMLLAACGAKEVEETSAPAPEQTEGSEPVCPPAPEATACPSAPEGAVDVVPFEEQWAASGHADASAVAFTYWNEEETKEVPAACAKCHSETGYLDFLGEDGSAAGAVDAGHPVGTVVTCQACHNEATQAMTSVVFPSGAELTGLGAEARCMQCHQGRASAVQVDEAIAAKASVEDLDAVGAELGFVNIHYYAAAATLYGTQVKGGYEYAGKAYDARFDHVEGYDSCIGCHNSHTLEVKVQECASCHTGVASQEDLRNVRMAGSLVDYDGDGDVEEGIAAEIESLQGLLYTAIQTYATEKSGAAIVYDSGAYPYFFLDTNTNGAVDEGEAAFPNRYNAWTGRLLRAAYNYQTSLKDTGGYAHGGKYLIELLYDSIEDLNTVISTPVDLSAAHRLDAGHFASSEYAFRRWDKDGVVPATCAKCHTAEGLPTFLREASMNRDTVTGINIAGEPASGLNCATCHNDVSTFTRFPVASVKFPSGAIVTFGEASDANLCIQCHQGRESKVSVDAAIKRAAVADDVTSEALTFRNPHYFAAGATLFGTEAKGAYEYDGQEYRGRFAHVEPFSTCIQCHDSHKLEVQTQACAGCHQGADGEDGLASIRMTQGDFDGDGDATEGLAGEVATMQEALYAALQTYAAETAGTPIIYDPYAYPYFFADADGSGTLDEGEEGYASWTPRLLRGAFNYQWTAKDPGAFAHNGLYIIQVLYDSLSDLGADVSGMTRP